MRFRMNIIPCQAAADLMTIMERNPTLEGERVAWVGDGNNVLHDLMLACAMLGVDCTWAVPKGYEPSEEVVVRAALLAEKSGAKLVQTHDPSKGLQRCIDHLHRCIHQHGRGTPNRQNV